MTEENKSGKGNLVLIGGAEDRIEGKMILKKTIELNNASNIAIITSATLFPLETGEDYYRAFRNLGVDNIYLFDIRNSYEAEKPYFIEKLQNIDMVFFTGGDQVRLTNILLQTRLLQTIKEKYLQNKLTIAGTSAGASAAAEIMTFDGDNEGLIKGSVKFDKGFGFLKDITIDTHFVARGRLGRLTQFLCSGHTNKGIGIGENTSITINPDNTMDVAGTGIVTVVSTHDISYSNFDRIKPGKRISIDGLRIGFLQENSRFDLKKWRIISS